MTEAEWLACIQPQHMVALLSPEDEDGPSAFHGKASDRKLRLLACGLARRMWDRIELPSVCRAVELAEQVADGLVRKSEHAIAEQLLNVSRAALKAITSGQVAEKVHCAALASASMFARQADWTASSLAAQTKLKKQGVAVVIRDIFGNPFRPVAFSPSWRSDTALSLARGMYESRDFGAMPILADALQDAGCDDDVLNHCRGKGPHVRGCWVVDLVLGKE